ncbi:hypothetical protein JYK02_13210 [Corallococcus macrosporus]|uniref:Uncharacterized protein n=1 Tax=Corallococcus macrosporus TaxID=35 RepID=A0ABS3D9Y8_9BACT|nr:hypothetical protein [Corallococcus macrosporus]MBN8228463.1 hypothetical protein [Corallococcus macrosporus]
MTQIKSPTGFVSSLKTALKTASTDGKAVGAPALKKALQGADAGKLSPQQKNQVRDAFEQVKLTPKAREIADSFVKAKDASILNPNDDVIVKIIADDPVRGGGTTEGGPGLQFPDDGVIVKIVADDPLRGGNTEGSSVKPQHGGGMVKVMMDDPTRGSKLPDFKLPDGGRVKIRMDDPTGGLKVPDFKPLDGGIVKVKMDSPV